ncbi:hypothetical protein O181_029869 [Austropuccinia psidii MF-1]|uniref:Tc1-like transposase DDE domain-containing protein n=1 Tax=Austropuccinia psidii MF-1 TaxID=1389203 RepID=A0A9Q3CRQ4_9BASI|nr:hypothetical protein [Austropuccinia psidii MF-1]
MEDGPPIHMAWLSNEWHQENAIAKLPLPEHSPDLNPIENVWRKMKSCVIKHYNPHTISELQAAIYGAWNELPSQFLADLLFKMHDHMQFVINHNGGPTRCQPNRFYIPALPLLHSSPLRVPILKPTLQLMSPSPARSKPPPSQLASLMNPTPDPPDKDNNIIAPEIYKSKPGFLTQSQYVDQPNTLAIILQKVENIEKRETNVNLPANLEILITCLNDRIDELAAKQSKMDKVINDLLAKIDNRKRQGQTNEMVSSPPTNHLSQTTNLPSFAEIAAGPRNMNELSLPKRPPQEICQNQLQKKPYCHQVEIWSTKNI